MALAALRPRKLSVDDYHRMAETGILRASERVELLDGLLIEMSPIGRQHRALHALIVEYLHAALAGRATIFGQFSWPLGEFDEPEPDVGIFVRDESAYFDRPIQPCDAIAILEIADFSLSRDIGAKRALYARFEIPEYLVVDVAECALLRFSAPLGGRYADVRRLGYGDSFALRALADATLAVDRFLPPLRGA
jgi:Uma2 family endonuclease